MPHPTPARRRREGRSRDQHRPAARTHLEAQTPPMPSPPTIRRMDSIPSHGARCSTGCGGGSQG
eukprot:4273723-Prymnesium_polylepis.1